MARGITVTVLLSVLGLAFVLARRHWRLGRGDRRGAARLAGMVFTTDLAASMLFADHTLGVDELGIVFSVLAGSLLSASLSLVLYLAVEPYVRRQWPHRLISWARLLAGGWRDPLVGRDVLLGTCMGAVMALLAALEPQARALLGEPPPRPDANALHVLLGPSEAAASILAFLLQSVFLAMGFTVLVMLLGRILRREWLAALAVILIMGLQQALGMETALWLALPFGLAIWAIPTLALLRFGLVAFSVGLLVVFLVANLPLTSRLGHWTAAPTLWVLAAVAAIAVWGFHTSLGGRSPFGESLED